MNVNTQLPFEFCEHCLKGEMEIKKQVLYSFDEIIDQEVQIVCNNEHLCRYLIKMIEKHGEIK